MEDRSARLIPLRARANLQVSIVVTNAADEEIIVKLAGQFCRLILTNCNFNLTIITSIYERGSFDGKFSRSRIGARFVSQSTGARFCDRGWSFASSAGARETDVVFYGVSVVHFGVHKVTNLLSNRISKLIRSCRRSLIIPLVVGHSISNTVLAVAVVSGTAGRRVNLTASRAPPAEDVEMIDHIGFGMSAFFLRGPPVQSCCFGCRVDL